MKYNQEHIYMLLLQKQLGEISEADDKLLQKVMQHDESVRMCWMELEEANRYTDNAFLDDIRAAHDWCRIEAILRPTPPFTKVMLFLKKYRAVAAVLITGAVMAGGYRLWQQQAPALTQQAQKAPIAHVNSVQKPAAPRHARQETAAVANSGALASLPTDTAKQTVFVAANAPLPDTGLQLPLTVKKVTSDAIYQSSSIEWNTLTVPPQTDYRLELSDGTEVHLNASSTLRFPFIFPGKTREVYLEGEAYFTVAHNPKQPFIVHTGTASVIALGTAFNVNSYDANMVTTSLVQGSVVTDVGDSLDVTLKPGYEAIYRPGERFKVKRFDESITLAWRDGLYRFHNKPLDDLAPVMQRWFGLKMEFARPAMAKRLFSGCLEKDKPVTDFLDNLCTALELEYKIYDNTIHFSRKGQKPVAE